MLRIVTTIIILALAVLQAVAQQPDFIRTDINYIEMNGDDWSDLQAQLDTLAGGGSKFNILHIGDSHIQADYMTAVTRRMLQERFGNGGRGCIAALRLAGTNQPLDYTLTADKPTLAKCRLTQARREIEPGLTGIGVTFSNPECRLTITLRGNDSLFSRVALLHGPSLLADSATVDDVAVPGVKLSDYATGYQLPAEAHTATLGVNIDGPLYGAYVVNSQPGVVYNSIGNNGACLSHYLKIDNFAQQTQFFNPHLIILSFGTNEAFGRASQQEIYRDIDRMIAQLRAANPDARFLLTTPMECQRRVSRKSRRYRVNSRIASVRDVIMRYGRENGVAVWDLYAIAGGSGSSGKWLDNGLLSRRDRIHCQVAGYELQGSLLGQALLQQLQPAAAAAADYVSHNSENNN